MTIIRNPHRTLSVLCLCMVATAGVIAVPAAEQQTKQRPASAKRPPLKVGDIDPGPSRVYVFVGKTGLGHEHAIEGRIRKGSLEFGAKSEAGEIVFDMRSFTADTQRARKYIRLEGTTPVSTQQKVTANMRGSDVLDTRRYPTATFNIDSAVLLPKTRNRRRSRSGTAVEYPRYQLDGKFTLHGVSRRLRVVAAAVGEKEGRVHLRGRFSLVQSQFGITPYSTALGAIGVEDELKVWGDLWVVKELPRQTTQEARRQR